MKLSQAMQIGINRTSGNLDGYISANGNEIRACALGASLLVIASSRQLLEMSEDELNDMIGQAFPEIYDNVAHLLDGSGAFQCLGSEIVKMNSSGIDRVAISKWVESVGY